MIDPVTHDLSRYMRQEDESAKRDSDIEQIIAGKKEQILNDEVLFQQLDEDYELDVYGQVMRALRSLDKAIKDYSAFTQPSESIEAVFTSLAIIQQNMESAIEHQAEEEYDGRME